MVQAQIQREGRGRGADRPTKGAYESADAEARRARHLVQRDRPDRIGAKLFDHARERRRVQPAVVPSPIRLPIGSPDMPRQREQQHVPRHTIVRALRDAGCDHLGNGERFRVVRVERFPPIRVQTLFAGVLYELIVELELKPPYPTPADQAMTLCAARSEGD